MVMIVGMMIRLLLVLPVVVALVAAVVVLLVMTVKTIAVIVTVIVPQGLQEKKASFLLGMTLMHWNLSY